MSAAAMKKPGLRGVYRRGYRPDVDECERQILDRWYFLDNVAKTEGADSRYARIAINQLHDLGIFRQRALARAAQAVRA